MSPTAPPDPTSIDSPARTALGLIGMAVLNLAALLSVWGDWKRVALIGSTSVLLLAFNLASTELLIPRLGVERGENIRAIPNLLGALAVGHATHWSLLALLSLPCAAVLTVGVAASRPTLRLVTATAAIAGAALWNGAALVPVACMAGLAVFWHLVEQSHVRFARALIGEQRDALEEAAAAQNAALANEKLATIGMLAAGVAHEINNPMGFVTANTHALLSDLRSQRALPLELAEYRDEVLPATLDGIRRINGIVSDLRRFSSGEPEQWIRFDLSAEISSAVRIARTQLRGTQVIHADLAQTASLTGLPRQISQVALNLIVNALQASRENGGEVRVTTIATPTEAVIRVQDNGAGIPPEVLQKLFTPFVTTQDAGTGTGLGLAFAGEIVSSHGGEIGVASVVGEGTTFEVSLPIVGRARPRTGAIAPLIQLRLPSSAKTRRAG